MKSTGLCNCKGFSNVYTDKNIETTEEDNDYENFDDCDNIIIDDEEDLDNDNIWVGSGFLVKTNFLFILKKILMLYLIKLSLFSTLLSKGLYCNIVKFRVQTLLWDLNSVLEFRPKLNSILQYILEILDQVTMADCFWWFELDQACLQLKKNCRKLWSSKYTCMNKRNSETSNKNSKHLIPFSNKFISDLKFHFRKFWSIKNTGMAED